MPGIARRRRQPGSGRRAGRRGRARPRARRGASVSARRREVEAASSRGRRAATAAGAGTSRSPVRGQRRPSAAISRRWIATARSNSISCSVMAAASASQGDEAAAERRSRGRPGRRGRSAGRRRSAAWKGARSSSTPVANRIRGIPPRRRAAPRRARAEDHPLARAAARRATWTGLPSRCSRRCSAAPRRRNSPSGEPPRRRNGQAARPRPERLPVRQPPALSPGGGGGRRPGRSFETISPTTPFCGRLGGRAGAAAATTATVAAPATKPVAASAAACRAGTAPARRLGTRGVPATTGRPSTTSPPRLSGLGVGSSVTLGQHDARPDARRANRRSRRLGGVPKTWSQYGAIPRSRARDPGSGGACAAPAAAAHGGPRPVVVHVVVDHVVGEVAGQEAGAERQSRVRRPARARAAPGRARERDEADGGMTSRSGSFGWSWWTPWIIQWIRAPIPCSGSKWKTTRCSQYSVSVQTA